MRGVRWFKDGRGFSWVVTLTGSGAIKASLRVVSTRRGLRVVRSIYLVPKRGSDECARELFVEYYDLPSFMEILNSAMSLVSQHSSEVEPLQQALVSLSRAVETLESARRVLEEVVSGARG